MAQVMIEEKYLEALGDALRKKTGTNTTWLPSEMPAVIRSLGEWSWVKDDGTHYFHLEIDEKWQLTQVMNLQLTGTIDWGDGTTTTCSHLAVTQESHTYATYGKYVIHVTSNSGTSVIWGANNFHSNVVAGLAVKYYELGKNWTYNTDAFADLEAVELIFIHLYDYDSTSMTGGTVVDLKSSWRGYYSLRYLYCTTGINLGVSVGQVVDPGLYFYALEAFICPSVAVYGSYNVQYNPRFTSLKHFGKGFIFNASGNIQNQTWFTYSGNLREFIRLPAGQTYFTYQNHAPGGGACYTVIIPSYITSIPSNTLNMTVRELHLLGTTPPTLSDDSITLQPQYSKIYVPTGYLSTYKSATNWANYADYMVEE